MLTPFLGECSDYRTVGGLLVPHQMVGSWIIEGTPVPYARFDVVRIEFDARGPFDGGETPSSSDFDPATLTSECCTPSSG